MLGSQVRHLQIQERACTVQVNHKSKRGGKAFTNMYIHITKYPQLCLRLLRYDPWAWTGDVGRQKGSNPSLLDVRHTDAAETPVVVRSNLYFVHTSTM